MKRSRLLILAAAISAMTSFSARAGEWKQDDIGWWYDNGDTTYENDGWSWINERWYYFTPEGYCLVNTTTPDNYQVDESGAWVVDGVVQTSGSDVAVISPVLRFVKPEGYHLQNRSGDVSTYLAKDIGVEISVSNINYTDKIKEKYPDDDNVIMDLDRAMGYYGDTGSKTKTTCQFTSGEWSRYDHTNHYIVGLSPVGRIDMTFKYARLVGDQWHIITFSGKDAMNIDTDSIMNTCVQ